MNLQQITFLATLGWFLGWQILLKLFSATARLKILLNGSPETEWILVYQGFYAADIPYP